MLVALVMTFSPVAIPPLVPVPQAVVLVLDADAIAGGVAPNFFTDADLDVPGAAIGRRAVLPFFAGHVGTPLTLYSGAVGDEGWFALASVPPGWAAAGPTGDGVRNYLEAGPGLGTPDAGGDPESLLGGVAGIVPLRATGAPRASG